MTMTKTFLASKTIWGIFLVAVGTIADSSAPLADLLGVEWAGKVVLVAGLILAFWGRMSANTKLTLLPCLALGLVMIGGCSPGAGQAAREGLLSPAAVRAWSVVREDAVYGIEAKVRDGVLTDATASGHTERLRLFDEAVTALGSNR